MPFPRIRNNRRAISGSRILNGQRKRARTNGYEIMTALGRRYHRTYVEGRGDAPGEDAVGEEA